MKKLIFMPLTTVILTSCMSNPLTEFVYTSIETGEVATESQIVELENACEHTNKADRFYGALRNSLTSYSEKLDAIKDDAQKIYMESIKCVKNKGFNMTRIKK